MIFGIYDNNHTKIMDIILFCFIAMFTIYFIIVNYNFLIFEKSGNYTRHYHKHNGYLLNSYNPIYDKLVYYRYNHFHNYLFEFD